MSPNHTFQFARHLAGSHLPAFIGRRFVSGRANKHNYYLLLEYPKCGRSWLRYIINQAESRISGISLLNTLHGFGYPELDLPRVRYVHGFRPGIPVTMAHIVANCTFGKMQEIEAKGCLNPSWLRPASRDPRARKKRAGSDLLEDHLDNSDVAYIRSVYQESPAIQELDYATL